MIKFGYCLISILQIATFCLAQQPGNWGDQHNGTYRNPILPGDFQNTDIIRVGSDYYYISATKQLSPGMMILTSKDLVNWTIIGHAVSNITDISSRYNYDKMEGSNRGIWAGSIRYYKNKFYIYFTDPDEGIFMTSAANPGGPWKPLMQMLKEPGWDDPCPFWDDDDKAYLVVTHFSDNYKIHLFSMTNNGEQLLIDSDHIIHQSKGSEANKIYKINNYYYHFFSEVTSEGRMPFMARSYNIAGPYSERKQLIHKADSEPNQGGLVQTNDGKWYFVTHQGKAYWDGREASLLPVSWVDGWPVWGKAGLDGIGNMVWSAPKPIQSSILTTLQASDDFNSNILAPQWEWFFEPRNEKWSLTEKPGYLRLYACKALQPGNINKTTNVLTQRPLRLKKSTVTVKIDISHMVNGQITALSIFGKKTGEAGIAKTNNNQHFYFKENVETLQGPLIPATITTVWLRSIWDVYGIAYFFYSINGIDYTSIGHQFQIYNFGNYLGAKLGIFTANDTGENGFVDIDWFHYEGE